MADYIRKLWEHIPQINIFGHFSSRSDSKKFSDKILSGNNVTHLLKKKFSKDVNKKRKITLSKASKA